MTLSFIVVFIITIVFFYLFVVTSIVMAETHDFIYYMKDFLIYLILTWFLLYCLFNVVTFKSRYFETSDCRVEKLGEDYIVTYDEIQFEVIGYEFVNKEDYERYTIQANEQATFSKIKSGTCYLLIPTGKERK